MNLFQFFAVLFTLVYAAHRHQVEAACECLSLVYIEKPTTIQECKSIDVFLNQISKNFKKVYSQLETRNKCDFTSYRTLVEGMENRIVNVVKAYFNCTEDDCTNAIMTAYSDFAQYRKLFNIYTTRCSFTYFAPECSQTLMKARSPVYESPENIMTSLLTCANLKSKPTEGAESKPTSRSTRKSNAGECNCVKIDDRPIPKNKNECSSKKYVATINKFIKDNFARIEATYKSSKNLTCDYSKLTAYVQQINLTAQEAVRILESTSPTFAELEKQFQNYLSVVGEYSPGVREYILTNSVSCNVIPRKARQTPLSIIDAIFGILTRCVGYHDELNHRCFSVTKSCV